MLAYQFHEWGEPPGWREVAPPSAGQGEVVIRIAGAGACHSDLNILAAKPEQMPWQLPFTLGHENAGWIAELGPGVTGWEVGQPVAVYGPWGCGHCRMCRLSAENCCEINKPGTPKGGSGRDGGMAELMLVPAPRLLLPLADLDPVEAAPLTDAALTPYHAIKRALPLLGPGSSALVIGLGGLGHMALQLLRVLTPAKVIAVDAAPTKVEAAARYGADVGIVSGEDTVADVLEHTAGKGATVVFDLVAASETVKLAGAVSTVGGEVSVIGKAGAELPVGMGSVAFDCTVVAPYWGTAVELGEVIALAERGMIKAEVERFPLTEADSAYAKMKAGSLAGRAVIVPDH